MTASQTTLTAATFDRPMVVNLFAASERLRHHLAYALHDHFIARGCPSAVIIPADTPIGIDSDDAWPDMAVKIARRRLMTINHAIACHNGMVFVEEPVMMLAMAAETRQWGQFNASRLHDASTVNILFRTGNPYDKVVEAMLADGLDRSHICYDEVEPNALGPFESAKEIVVRHLVTRPAPMAVEDQSAVAPEA